MKYWFYRLCTGVALITLALICPILQISAQDVDLQWEKNFGGSGFDYFTVVKQTNDGGYLLGGYSDSGISGDKTQAHTGNYDFWVIKIDAQGAKQWDRTLGGSGTEWLYGLHQTPDGGYLVAGRSDSGVSGTKTQASQGQSDYWVVKLDANGNQLWDKAYGGSGSDMMWCLTPTGDGGCLLGGATNSTISGDKTEPTRGDYDYWLVKLDAQGNLQWDKTLGGSGFDEAHVVQQTSDGGYIVGGQSASGISGDKTEANRGKYDYWIVKLDAGGAKQWDRTFGGDSYDYLTALQQTSDGGYVLAGSSMSQAGGEKTEPSRGNYDYWAVKIRADGTKEWDKTLGTSSGEAAYGALQTPDGGYLLAGYSNIGSNGDRTQASRGGNDFWLVKLTASGAKQWDLAIGGSGFDNLTAMAPTKDNGYILGGLSTSGIGGEKSEANRGSQDYWVVKLAKPTAPVVSISGDSVLCAATSGRLTAVASIAASSYLWNTGAATPSIAVTQAGIYSVQVTAPNGLVGTASYAVRMLSAPCTPTTPVTPVASSLVVPNIITPNGDGVNDNFRIGGLTAGAWHLSIYNSWGRELYHTSNYQHNWGRDAAPGRYYYILQQPTTGALYKGWLEVLK